MRPHLALAGVLVALSSGGCTVVRIAPDVISSFVRTHSLELDKVYDAIDKGDFPLAESRLKQLDQEKPERLLVSEIAYLRALLAERQGQTTEALARYRAVVTEHPDTPDAYLAARKIPRLQSPTPALAGPDGGP